MAPTRPTFILIILFNGINFSVGIDNQDLHDWHAKICDQNFSCPAPKDFLLNLNATRALLKVVDCDEPSAIFRYDFKVSKLTLRNLSDKKSWKLSSKNFGYTFWKLDFSAKIDKSFMICTVA